MARIRLGFALEDRARARLEALSERLRMSQNAVVEALLVAITDAAALPILEEGQKMLADAKGARLMARREAIERMSNLTPFQQDELIAQLRKGESGAP